MHAQLEWVKEIWKKEGKNTIRTMIKSFWGIYKIHAMCSQVAADCIVTTLGLSPPLLQGITVFGWWKDGIKRDSCWQILCIRTGFTWSPEKETFSVQFHFHTYEYHQAGQPVAASRRTSVPILILCNMTSVEIAWDVACAEASLGFNLTFWPALIWSARVIIYFLNIQV